MCEEDAANFFLELHLVEGERAGDTLLCPAKAGETTLARVEEWVAGEIGIELGKGDKECSASFYLEGYGIRSADENPGDKVSDFLCYDRPVPCNVLLKEVQEGQVKIFVESAKKGGKATSMMADPEKTTVEKLKDMYFYETGIPAEQQRIMFEGALLEDERMLAHYEIGRGSRMQQVLIELYVLLQ